MALQEETLSLIAFKSIFNKSHTDNTKNLGNESEDVKFNIHTNTIFASNISATPATAIAAGVAVAVTADLEIDLSSNGHAYFAKWPATAPSGTDPMTSSAYAYGAGVLTDISPGDRVRNSISFIYGSNYECIPYHTSVSAEYRISNNDARNWIFEYQSGVFFQQDLVGPAPLYMVLHAYTGDFLSDVIGISAWEITGGNIQTSNTLLTPLPNVLPVETAAQDLGSTSFRWNSLYMADTIDVPVDLDLAIAGSVIVNMSADGLKYAADYSAGYTNRSLVDKEYVDNLPSPGNKKLIEAAETITVQANHQYLIYGDLTIEGTLINEGEVVLINGAIVLSGSGIFDNTLGTLSLITVQTGTEQTNKYSETFSIASAPDTYTVTHNLGTQDIIWSITESGSSVDAQVTIVDANSVEVYSEGVLTSARINIVGLL